MQQRKDKWSVGQWMTVNPETVRPDTPVRDAFVTMRARHIRHLPVVADKKLVGIVTDRDLRRPDISNDVEGWNDFYKLDESHHVSDIMTADVATLRSHDRIEKALELFLDHRFGGVPVVDKNGEILGILTTHDAIAAFGEAMKQTGESLRA